MKTLSETSSDRLSWGAACLLSLISAFLLYLAFPHPRLAPLGWVAAVPFLLACRGQGARRGALLGFLLGAGFQSAMLSWALVFGLLEQVLLILCKAIPAAVTGAVLGAYRPSTPMAGALFAACAWLGMEYLQVLGPSGTTWGMLSHSQARVLPLIQVGELTGPWGLSWVMALTAASLAEWLRSRARAPLALSAGLVAALALWGFFCLHRPWTHGPTVSWGAVQISIPQDRRWDAGERRSIMTRLETLSRATGAQVVVWPETAVPYQGFLSMPTLVEQVAGLARATGSWILAGSVELARPQGSARNVATLFEPDGEIQASFDKIRLVPFAEYLPLPGFMREWAVFDRVMRYQPGAQQVVFRAADVPFGVLICYESMVPYEAARRVQAGAEVLVVITNDAWFGKSSAAMHHFDMAIMRAVEQRRPVVHCGNNGISGIIEATGRVVAETRLDAVTQVCAPVRGGRARTLYSKVGDTFAYLALIGLAALWRRR